MSWDLPPNGVGVSLELRVGNRQWSSGNHSEFFSAMTTIREVIERPGYQLLCYGASQDVYPSPMILATGDGDKAYRLTMGRSARTVDLVSIFDSGPDVVPSTVSEQVNFYQRWLKSLR